MADDDLSVPTPIPNSYWVIPNRLLAGEHPSGIRRSESIARLQRFLDAGVTSFVDLTEEDELPAYHTLFAEVTERPIRYRRWSIEDHSIPESNARMADILDHIDAELAAGRCVYVHCRAGIGRTGTTIACHLIRSGRSNEGALEELQRLWRSCARSRSWPSVPETEEQIAYVRNWRDRRDGELTSVEGSARREGALVGLAVAEALAMLVGSGALDASVLASRPTVPMPLASGADTAMARAVAESFLVHHRHEPADQLERYLAWMRSTQLPVPPDLKRALAVWQWSKKPFAGSHDPKNLDPHTLVRTVGSSMFYVHDVSAAIDLAAEVSRTTQQSPIVLDLCRAWGAIWVDALNGATKEALIGFSGAAAQRLKQRALKPQVKAFVDRQNVAIERPDDALGVSYRALESFARTSTFKDAVLRSIAQVPGKATAAALCGALAGAHYGIEAIPSEWRTQLPEEQALRSLARQFAT